MPCRDGVRRTAKETYFDTPEVLSVLGEGTRLVDERVRRGSSAAAFLRDLLGVQEVPRSEDICERVEAIVADGGPSDARRADATQVLSFLAKSTEARDDATLIRTIIHELSHPSLYVAGDTVFNESYATAVEEEGMRRWLERRGTPELREQDRLAQERQSGFEALLLNTRARLEALYAASGLTEADRRARKTAILADMNTRYAALKASWSEIGRAHV